MSKRTRTEPVPPQQGARLRQYNIPWFPEDIRQVIDTQLVRSSYIQDLHGVRMATNRAMTDRNILLREIQMSGAQLLFAPNALAAMARLNATQQMMQDYLRLLLWGRLNTYVPRTSPYPENITSWTRTRPPAYLPTWTWSEEERRRGQ
jgi:hypothetical protein